MSHPSPFFARLATESGAAAFWASPHDVKLLCAQRFVRLFGYGLSFLILVHYLSNLGITDARIGLFMTMTLLGDVVISFCLTLITDRIGRRRVLALGSGLMAASGVVFTFSSNYWLLLLASVVGVISPSGNEIGPFKAIEESILAQLTEKEIRSDIFAWYTLFGTLGAALGTVSCGFIVQVLQDTNTTTLTTAYRVMFAMYAVTGLIKLMLTLMLGRATESEAFEQAYEPVTVDMELDEEIDLPDNSDSDSDHADHTKARNDQTSHPGPRAVQKGRFDRLKGLLPSISAASRMVILRLLMLFAIDSFASGVVSPAWVTYYFTSYRNLSSQALGTLFFVTNIIATVSNLAALPVARRLGPLKTMVFTHLPSAIFLAAVALPPRTDVGTWISMMFLALRACTQSMDQAPRQAFISAMVLPGERTAVLGVVNIAKTLAQAAGIGCSPLLPNAMVMFGGAGFLKASYDLLLLWMFLGIRDRE